MRIFAVGAVLGLAGIYLDERWMTGAAIGVLALGLGLRFLPGQGGAAEPDEGHAGDLDGDRTGTTREDTEDGSDGPGDRPSVGSGDEGPEGRPAPGG